MNEKKQYKVTKEVVKLFDESEAALASQKMAINLVFFSKKAIWFGVQHRVLARKAWEIVYELYPDLKDKAIRFDYETESVYLIEEKKK